MKFSSGFTRARKLQRYWRQVRGIMRSDRCDVWRARTVWKNLQSMKLRFEP